MGKSYYNPTGLPTGSNGNTKGTVTKAGSPSGGTASKANLAIKSNFDISTIKTLTKDEIEAIQLVLDLIGLIPGPIGVAADGLNVSISALQGDFWGVLTNLGKAIPIAGDILGGLSAAAQATRYANAIKKVSKSKKILNALPKSIRDILTSPKSKNEIAAQTKKIKVNGGRDAALKKKKQEGDSKVKRERDDDLPDQCTACPTKGKPVNPVQGCKVLTGEDDTDFVLSGDLPLIWSRQYASKSLVGRGSPTDPIGWYGQGWSNTWAIQLRVKPNQDLIEIIDAYGRVIAFPFLAIGKSHYLRSEDIRLHHDAEGQYHLTSGLSETGDGISLHFGESNAPYKQYPQRQTLYCTGQSDSYGNRICLYYHQLAEIAHLPHYLQDSAGRLIELEFTAISYDDINSHRLTCIRELIGLSAKAIAKLPIKLQPLLGNVDKKTLDPRQLYQQVIELVKQNNLPKTILATRSLARYEYNATGDLIAVYPDNQPLANLNQPVDEPSRRYEWRNHIMTAHHFKDSISSYYIYDRYDHTGKVINNTISSGQSYHFDYHKDQSIVTEAKDTENERITTYHFNDKKYWTGITDALGNRTQFILDSYGRLIEQIDPLGRAQHYQFTGNLLSSIKQVTGYDSTTKLPLWRSQQLIYNNNRLSDIIDPLGNSTHIDYDEHGQPIAYTDPLGHTTKTIYDDHGRLSEQRLANGSHFDYSYNDYGELIEQSDCSGNLTTYEYDLIGRLISSHNAMDQQTRYFYDTKTHRTDAPTHIIYPDGSQERYQYDEQNRLIQHTDAKDQQTQYRYADDHLPTERINALGHTLAYEYDNLRRLVKLTNENGQNWLFNYDAADNLISETRFDGTNSYYKYNANSELIHQRDNDQHHHYQYDNVGQLIAKHSIIATVKTTLARTIAAPRQQPYTTRYHYDAAGQLIKASNKHSRTVLDYDAAGQLIGETLTKHFSHSHSSDYDTEQTLTHKYDEIGNRVATILPDGKAINQLYYGSGHLYNQSVQDGDSITEIRHSERNALHQETTRQQGELLSSFGYDPMGRLTKQYSSDHNKGRIIVQRDYNYDVLGQLTHVSGQTQLNSKTKDNSAANNTSNLFKRNHQYDYDKVGRLTQHKLTDFINQSGTTEHFAFDPASNRVPITTAGDSTDTKTKTSKQSDRPTKLISTDEVIRYTYDSHGRVLFKTIEPRQGNDALKQSSNALVSYKQSLQFYYNPNNELTQSIKVEQQGVKHTVTTTDYHYDAFSRRIHKSSRVDYKNRLHPNGKLLKQAMQTKKSQYKRTSYLWDGNRQAQEQTDTHVFTTVYEQDSFIPVARLVWLKGELLKAANDEIINAPRERWEDEPTLIPNIQIYHYHNDHLGTPNELTDHQGEVVWLADYDAWGNTAKVVWLEEKLEQLQVAKEHLQPLRFQGQYFDEETGLHYNRFRYFDPDLGMFTTRDPIGLAGGNNTFQYAPNPTGWVDPLGLAKTPGDCKNKLNRNQAFKKAKDVAGIPWSQQHETHWKVGGDKTRSGYQNYVYSSEPTHWGNFYQYRNASGELRVIVEHTNDPRGLHLHAGKAKGTDMRNYDFKNNRYAKIDYYEKYLDKLDHHIDYC